MSNTSEILQKIAHYTDKLYEDLSQGKSETLIKYLKMVSRFHNYSFHNQILISLQKPEATRVAGFNKWKQVNCFVKKGEKGIQILAPRISKYKEENNARIYLSTIDAKKEADTKESISFFPVYVFDVSQVDGETKDIEFFIPLGNTEEENYLSLKDIIEKQNIKVIEKTISEEGISTGGKIYIKQENDYNNKMLTLIHEWAHEIMHKKERKQQQKERELEAEAVSFIVSNYLDITNPFSSDYILEWGNTKEEFLKRMDTIKITSQTMIEIIEKEKQ